MIMTDIDRTKSQTTKSTGKSDSESWTARTTGFEARTQGGGEAPHVSARMAGSVRSSLTGSAAAAGSRS